MENSIETVNLVPRDASVIALDILLNTPEDKTEFRQALREFIFNHLPYCSPEMRRHPQTWCIFEENIMHRYIPVPKEPWEKEVVDIYLGKIVIDPSTFG